MRIQYVFLALGLASSVMANTQCFTEYCSGVASGSGTCQPYTFPTLVCDCSDIGKAGNAGCTAVPDAAACASGQFCNGGTTCDYSVCTVIPPPPPVGSCLPGTICGHVTSTESATPLHGMSVNLRSTGNNQIVTSTVTDATGFYSFSVAPGSAYYVSVALSRGESSIPAIPLVHETFQADFAVRGVRSTVNVTAPAPGSFVILTQNPISAGGPPAVRAGHGEASFSTVYDGINPARMTPTPGAYFLTCWTHVNGIFAKTSSQSIGMLNPQTVVSLVCQ